MANRRGKGAGVPPGGHFVLSIEGGTKRTWKSLASDELLAKLKMNGNSKGAASQLDGLKSHSSACVRNSC